MRRLTASLVLAAGVAVTTACALPAARAQETAVDGAERFATACGLCHGRTGPGTAILARRMEPGLAPLEARDDLPADYVRLVVREGLGAMPPLTRVDVSDAELDAIAAYLARE